MIRSMLLLIGLLAAVTLSSGIALADDGGVSGADRVFGVPAKTSTPLGIVISEEDIFDRLSISGNMHAQQYTVLDGAIRYWSNYALLTAGIIGLAVLTYAAYLYITSLGDDGQADKGKNLAKGVIIGIVIMVASYALVTTMIQYLPSGGSIGVDSGNPVYNQ